MGEWNTVYEDEVEGRLVTVKVYDSGEVEDMDEGIALRVTTTSINDHESGHILIPAPEAAGRTITLEPYDLDDLEDDLMEVGFSPAAATAIASRIPA